MKRITRLILLSLSLASASGAQAAEKLQVATSAGGASAIAAAVAKQLKFFDAAGLDVTLFDAGGGNNAVSTVVNGEAQIGIVGIRNASKPVEKGQDLKLIGIDTNALTQFIFVRSNLIDPKNPPKTLVERGALLRGKKIAVNDIGGSSGEFARYALSAAGLGERDAVILNINTAAGRLTALKAGRIDAIVGSAPEPETALTEGYGTMLVDPGKDVPEIRDVASTVHLVRADYLRSHGSLLRTYLQTVDKARQFVRAEPEKAKKAYYDYLRGEARGAELDPKIKDLAWANVTAASADSLVLSAGQYQRAQAFFKIPDSVTYAKFIDNALAESLGKTVPASN
ncbi:MAG: transporter substrate-binding protein [Hyphomicrobiales bacterium]|nr:transporter substrate-binding protein [Hyphomicrobiales bacterium]